MASKQRKVREMLAMLHLEETTNRMLQSQEERIQAMSQHQLAGATLNTEQKEHHAEFQEKVVTLLRDAAG
jgi:DNA polymerase II large subunit